MKKERKLVYKSNSTSKQHISYDTLIFSNIVEPFVSFESLLLLYYANTYHRKCITIKSRLLSQIAKTNLEKFLPKGVTPKDFLYGFIMESEIYGNSFIEKAPLGTLYQLPGYEARVDIQRNIYQKTWDKTIKLEGYHFKYYSPRSRFYGEPDYLATLLPIETTQKADRYNSAYLDNGAKPGFAIMFENSEPTDEQLAAFREFFADNYKGYDNTNKTIILSAKTDIGEKPAKIKLEKLSEVEDISFEKLKKVNRDEIIAAHGVPPRLIGVIHSGQLGGGNELLSQLHAFNELEIIPKQESIESFFNKIGIELKLQKLDTTNYKDDTDIVTSLLDRNIITLDEARELLNVSKK